MPTYEYECNGCGHTFEMFQYMSDKPLRKCPKCAKMKLNRLIGAGAGIIFKGSGFYETDYKRKGQPRPSESAPSAPASEPAAGADSPSPSADPKPAKAS